MTDYSTLLSGMGSGGGGKTTSATSTINFGNQSVGASGGLDAMPLLAVLGAIVLLGALILKGGR